MAAEGQNGSKMLDEMPEYRIFELLKKYHYTLTTAESATGGMIASTLINVPGISAFFTEGYVTYSNEAKVKMIHVKPETIERYGVVSAETAADMAVSAGADGGYGCGAVCDRRGRTGRRNQGMSGRACLHRLLPARKGCHGTASVCGRPDAGAEKCHRCGASFTCPHDHRGGNHMRIIAGTARSLPLKAPGGNGYETDHGPDQGDAV